jgi:hypothetical protein
MKNLHVLPTDKPSRFSLNSSGKYHLTNHLYTNSPNFTNQNIYITSDEEIKEDDWFTENGINTLLQWRINKWKMSYSFPSEMNDICKKIILTTDQDLIKDGVQAIDDEFLRWFVDNPSCEEIKVKKGFADGTAWGYNFLDYKIIIPKEEPKSSCPKCRTTNFNNCHSIQCPMREEPKFKNRQTGAAGFENGNAGNSVEWFEQFKKKGGDK